MGTQTVWVNTDNTDNTNYQSTVTASEATTAAGGYVSTIVTTVGVGNSGTTLSTIVGSLLTLNAGSTGSVTLVYYTTSGGSAFLVTSVVSGLARSALAVTLVVGSSTIVTSQSGTSVNFGARGATNPFVGIEKDLSVQKAVLSLGILATFAAFNIL